jgi:hypothetical protein
VYVIPDKARDLAHAILAAFREMGRGVQDEAIPEKMRAFNALYLGNRRVESKPPGSVYTEMHLERSFNRNSAAIATLRKARKKKKESRLSIDAVTHTFDEDGNAIDEHPVVIVATSKSLRIVDAITGTTINKYLASWAKWCGVLSGPPEVVGFICKVSIAFTNTSVVWSLTCWRCSALCSVVVPTVWFGKRKGCSCARMSRYRGPRSLCTQRHCRFSQLNPFSGVMWR